MKVVDPVCKMTIESEKAATTSEHKGRTIYFCAKGCKSKFDLAPEKYLGLERDTVERSSPVDFVCRSA